jgi:hypothetical protein
VRQQGEAHRRFSWLGGCLEEAGTSEVVAAEEEGGRELWGVHQRSGLASVMGHRLSDEERVLMGGPSVVSAWLVIRVQLRQREQSEE